MNWIKTHDDQRVNADEIVRMCVIPMCVIPMYFGEKKFRWALVFNMRNGEQVIYAQSEHLKDSELDDDYRPADAVRSEECRQALLDELDSLTESL